MLIAPQIRRFVESARVARLATASANGEPHLVAVTFVLIEDDIFIAIDEKPKTTTRLRRVTNIEQNPRATLLVDSYDEDWTKLGWAMLRGSAGIVAPGDPSTPPRDEILAELRAKYPQYHEHNLAGRPLIFVSVERVTRWGETGG